MGWDSARVEMERATVLLHLRQVKVFLQPPLGCDEAAARITGHLGNRRERKRKGRAGQGSTRRRAGEEGCVGQEEGQHKSGRRGLGTAAAARSLLSFSLPFVVLSLLLVLPPVLCSKTVLHFTFFLLLNATRRAGEKKNPHFT